MTVTIKEVIITPILNIFYCDKCQTSEEHGGTERKCPTCSNAMNIIGFIESGIEE